MIGDELILFWILFKQMMVFICLLYADFLQYKLFYFTVKFYILTFVYA